MPRISKRPGAWVSPRNGFGARLLQDEDWPVKGSGRVCSPVLILPPSFITVDFTSSPRRRQDRKYIPGFPACALRSRVALLFVYEFCDSAIDEIDVIRVLLLCYDRRRFRQLTPDPCLTLAAQTGVATDPCTRRNAAKKAALTNFVSTLRIGCRSPWSSEDKGRPDTLPFHPPHHCPRYRCVYPQTRTAPRRVLSPAIIATPLALATA